MNTFSINLIKLKSEEITPTVIGGPYFLVAHSLMKTKTMQSHCTPGNEAKIDFVSSVQDMLQEGNAF